MMVSELYDTLPERRTPALLIICTVASRLFRKSVRSARPLIGASWFVETRGVQIRVNGGYLRIKALRASIEQPFEWDTPVRCLGRSLCQGHGM